MRDAGLMRLGQSSGDADSDSKNVFQSRLAFTHVIVELKRASVLTDTDTLYRQIGLYRSALQKILREIGQEDDPIEIVCVVGRELKDWANPNGKKESENTFKVRDARVVRVGLLR